MNHCRKSAPIILLTALALLSCMKEADTGRPEGMLRAVIVQPETRTSFDGGTGKFRWSEGDRIAIHLSSGSFCEAEVDDRTGFFECPTTASCYRDFFAVYPASVAVEDAYGNPDLNVVLPAEYDISSNLNSDYAPLPMIAVNREEESDLYFNHAGGLIRVILSDVPAGASQVRVTFDHNVTGKFGVHWASDRLPFISEGGDGTVVTFRLSESTLGAVTDGIRLNIPVPTGHYGLVTVETLGTGGAVLSKVSADLAWDCRRAHGRLFDLETNAYTFTCSAELTLPAYPGGISEDLLVTSYKVRHGSGTTDPIPWEVDGYFADADCQTPLNGSDASVTPVWLASLGTDGTGSGSVDPLAVQVVYKSLPQVLQSETYSSEAQAINAWIASSTFGAGSSPWNWFNLANPSDMSSDFIAESANSYIVNGPGYYRIPLVMGNGVIDNAVNPEEASYKGMSGGSDVISFCDYTGTVPDNPYLHRSSAGVGTPTTAYVVWEDEDNFIEVAEPEDCTLPGPALVMRNDVWWLQFHVVKPVQGNAVIAVADENGDVMWSWHIWQTDYVPANYGGNDDIPVTEHSGVTYRMSPRNLGYVVSGAEREWFHRGSEAYVRLRQEGSLATCTLHIIRPSASHREIRPPYYGPYYQWGRKDAIHPGKYVWYGRSPVMEPYFDYYCTMRNGILHPEGPLVETEPSRWLPSGQYNRWNAVNILNTVNNNRVVKTINDPCPAGYTMPPSGAFTGFSTTGGNCPVAQANMFDADGNGLITADDVIEGGVSFYTDASRTATIHFPMLNLYTDNFSGSIKGGAYWTAGPSKSRASWLLLYFYQGTTLIVGGGGLDGTISWNLAARPVAAKTSVFSDGSENAVSTGIPVDSHDFDGKTWE